MNKKAMAILPILLIALSAVGFAYATWSDQVEITGEAKMGEFIVGILKDSVTVKETPEGEYGKPDVCDATVECSEEETSKHHVPTETVWKKMIIKIDNAYPSWDLHVRFNLKNAGTIPAHITVTISGYDDINKNCEFDAGDEELTYIPCTGFFKDKNGNGVQDLPDEPILINFCVEKEIWIDGVFDHKEPLTTCQQLEPCTCTWVQLDIHFKEEAEQCHLYKFKVKIHAVQWNKA